MTRTPESVPAELTTIASPLILEAQGELLFFRTAAHLAAYVEPIDVAIGEYGSCWDMEGRLLTLSISARRSTVLGVIPYRQEVVRVQAAEARPTHLNDLHLALLRHLVDLGLEGQMPVTNDTTDLIEFAIQHAGWS